MRPSICEEGLWQGDSTAARFGAAPGLMEVEGRLTDKSSSSLPASLTKALTLSTLVSGVDLRVAAKILETKRRGWHKTWLTFRSKPDEARATRDEPEAGQGVGAESTG